jgi:VanZ family protein
MRIFGQPMVKKTKTKYWKWLASGWFILTTFLLVIPGNALPKTNLAQIPNFDKWVHVGLFAIFSFLMLAALKNAKPVNKAIILLVVIAYGTLMEYVQLYLVANRSFDERDIVADAAGAALGLIVFYFARKKI